MRSGPEAASRSGALRALFVGDPEAAQDARRVGAEHRCTAVEATVSPTEVGESRTVGGGSELGVDVGLVVVVLDKERIAVGVLEFQRRGRGRTGRLEARQRRLHVE